MEKQKWARSHLEFIDENNKNQVLEMENNFFTFYTIANILPR